MPFTDSIAGNIKTPMLVLLDAVCLVLPLIACSYIAGLMPTRALERSREIAGGAAWASDAGT